MNPTKLTDKRGNLRTINPTHDDPKRIRQLLGRLEKLETNLPAARGTVDARIRDCVDAQGQGSGSGISDPVARAATQITTFQHQHRQLSQGLRSIEDAVEHLTQLCAQTRQSAAAVIADPVRRCPVMVLTAQTLHLSNETVHDEVLLRCDRLTAHKLDERGNPIDYDPDDYCDTHRSEANEAAKRAHEVEQLAEASNARRLRYHRKDLAG